MRPYLSQSPRFPRQFANVCQLPLAAALMALAVGACAEIKSYSGPPSAESNTATISGRFVPLNEGVSKITIAPLTNDEREPLSGWTTTLAVPAGEQIVYASFCAPSGAVLSCRQSKFLRFQAEAGHAYAIEGADYGRMWVIDSTTGELVADFPTLELRPTPASEQALVPGPLQGQR